MKFKFFILVVFLLFGQNNLLSQQYLNVPLIGQEHPESCWAASMEMIHKFHINTSNINQCKILNKYLWFKTGVSSIDCNNFDCNQTSYASSLLLPFSSRPRSINPHYFDLINSNFGFNSMEDLEISHFNWSKIVTEIKSCRPFAMFLVKSDPVIGNFNHVVVAKGYLQYGNENYILVNDPQNTSFIEECVGCEFLIPFNAYKDNITELNSCIQVARSIFPKDTLECKDCTKLLPASSNDLVSGLLNNTRANLLPGLDKYVYSDIDINSLLTKSINQGRPLYRKQSIVISDSDGSILKNLFALVAVQSNPQIAIIFEPNNLQNEIKQISNNKCTLFFETIRLSFFNSNNVVEYSYAQYEILEVIPNFQHFYRIKNGNTYYLAPVKKYPGSPFDANKLYKESNVFNYLKETNISMKPQNQMTSKKKCFIFNWFKRK